MSRHGTAPNSLALLDDGFDVRDRLTRGHDLRRTAASLMIGAGIPRLVASKILNHVETGVTAVYDRHSYDPEKRAALDSWGKHLFDLAESRQGR